ncbi:GH25 family lysozyme [Rhizobium ruizarguesonis]|uniref:GH25 family lysozyme n=1 Tax=Rhizobium ruizarguesonis TaxID=2081791 RepID=UPI00094980C0|nr:GH25 family lysozyme [Rhizobium ruizarguesonis]UED34218.1 caspase family protein [Rhizobium ruizarguesonis]
MKPFLRSVVIRIAAFAAVAMTAAGMATSGVSAEDFSCDNGALVKDGTLCQFFRYYAADDKEQDPRVVQQLGAKSSQSIRSIAIVIAIDHYAMEDSELPPAKIDGDNLEKFLIDGQKFDEVIVLRNEQATKDRIEYFIGDYVNSLYALYQGRTRVLFAYSGHGTRNLNSAGSSLVLSAATSTADLPNLIPLSELNEKLHQASQANYQVLALINACYGAGVFQSADAGGNPFITSSRGAHAMTAGSPDELVWSRPGQTSGSIFFDAIIRGIDSGDADKSNHVLVANEQGESFVVPSYIVRLGSLLQYVTEKVQDLGVNPATKKAYGFPWLGSVMASGAPSEGAFFFLAPQTEKLASAAAFKSPASVLLASATEVKSQLGTSFSFPGGSVNSIPDHPGLKVFNPPENYAVHGIDISQWNKIDWRRLSLKEVGFVYIRATAISGADKAFSANWNEARRRGFVRGAYHYFGVCEDPKKQFERIASVVKTNKGDLPVAVDVDWPPLLNKQKACAAAIGKERVASNLEALLQLLEAHYGRKPVIYGNKDVFNDLLLGRSDNYPIWFGERDKPAPEAKLGGNRSWLIWQYTERKKITGISGLTDGSVFHGTSQEFSDFLAGAG